MPSVNTINDRDNSDQNQNRANQSSHRWLRLPGLISGALLLITITTSNTSTAFEDLTEAQSWIYDRNHLSNTSQGQIVEYHFVSSNNLNDELQDTAKLTIQAEPDEDRRDVTLDFLTDDRRLSLPDFKGFRGNPVVIAMLEKVAQDMGEETGGGVLYFRNRIRDALASDAVILHTENSDFNSESVETTKLTFYPFKNDNYLVSTPLLKETAFEISLSDAVPGSVLAIHVLAESSDQRFLRQLKLK